MAYCPEAFVVTRPLTGPPGPVPLYETAAPAMGPPKTESVTVPARPPTPWQGRLPESTTVPSVVLNWKPAEVVVKESLSAPATLPRLLITRLSEPEMGLGSWPPDPATNSTIPVVDGRPVASMAVQR